MDRDERIAPSEPVDRPRRARPAGVVLFVAALAFYAVTRLVALTDFPIFFFCDEAIQTNVARSLLDHKLRDRDGVLLPPYFLNDQRWAMSLNIYLMLPTVALLDKSIFSTRATFVAVSVFGAAALGLALRTAGFEVWWLAPLLLAALPVDFLHSRMALETTPAFFAAFLWAYFLYRFRSPWYLPLALAFAGATFYSYTAGQGIVLIAGLLLFFSDLRYHLRWRPKVFAVAAAVVLVLAVPFWRERHRHPRSTREQLEILHSYWITPLPLTEKLRRFGREYVSAFEPGYWFRPNEAELTRHRMDDMPYVPVALAPLIAVGIATGLARFRTSPAHRAILLSPIAVPFAAAADHRQILRVLPMVVPLVLLAAAGAQEVFRWIRSERWRRIGIAALAVVLFAASLRMATRAVREGPFWYRDYGLYGMQYGAKQVFREIREELKAAPDERVHLSSTWANNPNEFLDFFLTPEERRRAQMGDVDSYRLHYLPLGDADLFVMTADQYAAVRKDAKLLVQAPKRVLRNPDGTPAFTFARISYSPTAASIFEAEREERRKPREETVLLGGERVLVRHSLVDMGSVDDLVDGRFDGVFRGLEANPFFVEFVFPTPKELSQVDLSLSRMNCEIRIDVTPAGGGETWSSTRVLREPPGDSTQAFPFGKAIRASAVRITVRENDLGEPAHIELREVAFRP